MTLFNLCIHDIVIYVCSLLPLEGDVGVLVHAEHLGAVGHREILDVVAICRQGTFLRGTENSKIIDKKRTFYNI